ncbi:unnamed protein product [Merluccius merluccius]
MASVRAGSVGPRDRSSRCYAALQPTTNLYLQRHWDHTRYQGHRHRLQDEQLADIKRHNKQLSSKLSGILQSRGQVDNWNIYHHRSLNADKRRAELAHISCQNQAIFQRITVRQSEYRRQLWLDDWERAERRQKDIGRYNRCPAHKPRPERRVQFAVGDVKDHRKHLTTSP